MTRRTRPFKNALSRVFRLWERGEYDTALRDVELLLEQWQGNPQLQILRGSLIQLQGRAAATLDDAKQALQSAVELDPSSPAASIELGHFFDAVEDNPGAAAKIYAKAITNARRLLIEALIGQAKSLLQLDRKEEALDCLAQLIDLNTAMGKRSRHINGHAIIKRSPTGLITMLDVHGPYAEQIEQLVNEALAAS